MKHIPVFRWDVFFENIIHDCLKCVTVQRRHNAIDGLVDEVLLHFDIPCIADDIARGYLFLRTVGRSLRGNLFECDWEEEGHRLGSLQRRAFFLSFNN